MTNDITLQIKLQREKQEHELRIEMFKWMSSKHGTYILMMAGGVAFAAWAKFMAERKQIDEPLPPPEKKDFWDDVKGVFDQIGAGLEDAAPLAGVLGMLAALRGDPNKAMEWTGEGIAALGATCLLLDAAGGLPGIKAGGLI